MSALPTRAAYYIVPLTYASFSPCGAKSPSFVLYILKLITLYLSYPDVNPQIIGATLLSFIRATACTLRRYRDEPGLMLECTFDPLTHKECFRVVDRAHRAARHLG